MLLECGEKEFIENFGVKALGNFLLRKNLEGSRNINHSTTTIGLLLLNLYITS
jgi:hypothetical protein